MTNYRVDFYKQDKDGLEQFHHSILYEGYRVNDLNFKRMVEDNLKDNPKISPEISAYRMWKQI